VHNTTVVLCNIMASCSNMDERNEDGKVLDFFMKIGKLKQLRRTGWVRNGVSDPESVADHMYRMSIMSFLLKKDTGLDISRCIKISVAHDMAECIVGDLTPFCGVSKEEKHEREREAMRELCSMIGPDAGQEIEALWQEYESQSSPEARAVKDLDRFDMILQAYEYETQELRPQALQQFFDTTAGQFNHPVVRGWVDELAARRSQVPNTSGDSSTQSKPRRIESPD